ncbi:phospholipase D-like domain-containing protein [Chitinophaga alhagiae]|uniref:phospholipase D-like domain-containing protein n=1 Tax=Chitinophaga alhagiae TaxID=2203219 RepID=UPI001E559182|nr:phospholipase D-like domain-containing protein [Chitinophaga alhagiae]
MNGARETVHLQTYIFGNDATGQQVADALIRAAQRGVQVYLLTDGYASQHLNGQLKQRLIAGGVHFRWFEPLFRSRRFYVGRRLHHKVTVVDGRYALVGGINIGDRYNDVPGDPAWLDAALYVEGEVCAGLSAICCKMWNGSYYGRRELPAIVPDGAFFPSLPPGERCSVRVRRNDWVGRKAEIWKSYFHMFSQASKEVIVMCSYFLPGWRFRQQMARAVKRGVKVKVIVTGPSDVMLAKSAERYLYRWMLENGISVFEYANDVLHAKLALRDGRFMTIGSYNVNNFSAYASIELNLDVRNRPLVRAVRQRIETIIDKDCREITEEYCQRSYGVIQKYWQRFAYEIVKVLLYFFTVRLRRKGR